MYVLALSVMGVFVNSQAAPCNSEVLKVLKTQLKDTKILECVVESSVISAKIGGNNQAVVLTDSAEGISVLIYPTLANVKGSVEVAPQPLFVFSGLGEAAIQFDAGDATGLRLLVKDLDGDSYKDLAVLGVGQPNATLTLKAYSASLNRFRDLVFKADNDQDRELSIVVLPGETLKIPTDIKKAFEVRGKTATRTFMFSKYLN